MLSKKLIIIGAASLAAIIIIVLLVLAYSNNSAPAAPNGNQPEAGPDLQGGLPFSDDRAPSSDSGGNLAEPGNQPFSEAIPSSGPLDEVARNRQEVLKIASDFAARFGTYSNQSSYDNIRDLQPQMTRGMRGWSTRYIADLERANPVSASLFSVATQSLTTKIENFSLAAGSSLVTVGTRRQVGESAGEPDVFNQDIQLDFVRLGGEWLVKGAFWQVPEQPAAQIFEPVELLR